MMQNHMFLQTRIQRKLIPARVTYVGLLPRVRPHMHPQMRPLIKPLQTHLALVQLNIHVHPHVPLQPVREREPLPADRA